MIPKVHQIVFSDTQSVTLEGYARAATQSVRDTFTDHDYQLWDLDHASAFVEQHFSHEVVGAFRTLTPYAFKADLFKLCVLKVQGGWLVDIGVRMLKNPVAALAEQDPEFVVFRTTGVWDPPWNCSLALLYAAPGHPVFDTAITAIVENCRNRFYGATPLLPTMSPFGRALAQHEVFDNMRVGLASDVRFRSYRREYRLKPLGRIAARKPKSVSAGNIGAIGIPGTNNYVHLWRDRRVYGE